MAGKLNEVGYKVLKPILVPEQHGTNTLYNSGDVVPQTELTAKQAERFKRLGCIE